MNHRLNLFILCSIVLLFACCKTKQFTPTNFEGEKISFGNFGGFTGEMDAYHLIDNGQLYQQEGRTQVFNAVPSVDKKVAAAIFQELKDLKLDQLKFDKPGNMNFFIEYHTTSTSNKVVWSDEIKDVDPAILVFFGKLNGLLKAKE